MRWFGKFLTSACLVLAWLACSAASSADTWVHASPTSAVIAWETDDPAKSWIEYGRTAQYGQKTAPTARAACVHIHHLRDLETGVAYHYRLVAEGEGGKRMVGDDATFTPGTTAGAVTVPGNLAGPPYVLDRKGATYVLTKDVETDGTAFEIKGNEITLDLDGHTVAFSKQPDAKEPAHGIVIHPGEVMRVLNGHLKQRAPSAGACGVKLTGTGQPTVSCGRGRQGATTPLCVEVAGLSVDTRTGKAALDVECMIGGWIHHNALTVSAGGTEAPVGMSVNETVRHTGPYGPRSKLGEQLKLTPFSRFEANRVVVTGRCGVSVSNNHSVQVMRNEIRFDATVTEGQALRVSGTDWGGQIGGNRILARGVSPTGIELHGADGTNFAIGTSIEGNHVDVEATRGDAVGIALQGGIREGGISKNNVTVRAGEGRAEGIRITGVSDDTMHTTVSGNTVNADGVCVAVTGGTTSKTLVFRDNTLRAKRCGVMLADARDVRFVRTTLAREEDADAFKAVRCSEGNGMFLDTTFSGGASWNDVVFEGKGDREIAVGRAVAVSVIDANKKPVKGVEVVVRPEKATRDYPAGTTEFEGKPNRRSRGTKPYPMDAPVIEHVLRPAGKTTLVANTILASAYGYERAAVAVKSDDKSVEIILKPGVPDPEIIIREKRATFPDKAKPAGDWDWLHAPLTKIREPWIYASMNSASVYWQTDGRGWGYVEYGKTKGYGSTTAASEEPSFAQLHHLSGLATDVTWHYRLVSVGVDGKRAVSDDMTFRTKLPEGKVIRVPDDFGKHWTYDLTESGATYIVTKPLPYGKPFTPGKGVKDIVIDFNGHTVRFGGDIKSRIVRWGCDGRLILCNGIVRDEGLVNGVLSFRLPRVQRLETFGMTIHATGGIHNYRGPADIHHNRISHPVRTRIGPAVGLYPKGTHRVHHNIFPNAAGPTIGSTTAEYRLPVEVFENDFELDTWSGGYGVALMGKGHTIHDNRFIARGECPVAIAGFTQNVIQGNLIDVMVDTPARGGRERAGAVALKVDPSAKTLEFSGNTVVVRGARRAGLTGAAGNACAVRLAEAQKAAVTIKDNTIVTIAGATGTKALAATTDGKDDASDSVAKDNRIIAK